MKALEKERVQALRDGQCAGAWISDGTCQRAGSRRPSEHRLSRRQVRAPASPRRDGRQRHCAAARRIRRDHGDPGRTHRAGARSRESRSGNGEASVRLPGRPVQRLRSERGARQHLNRAGSAEPRGSTHRRRPQGPAASASAHEIRRSAPSTPDSASTRKPKPFSTRPHRGTAASWVLTAPIRSPPSRRSPTCTGINGNLAKQSPCISTSLSAALARSGLITAKR